MFFWKLDTISPKKGGPAMKFNLINGEGPVAFSRFGQRIRTTYT